MHSRSNWSGLLYYLAINAANDFNSTAPGDVKFYNALMNIQVRSNACQLTFTLDSHSTYTPLVAATHKYCNKAIVVSTK
jgi:hypothetical protein